MIEMMIEIFRTDVKNKQLASKIAQQISNLFPVKSIHFDLADCDRVLRIEASHLNNLEVIKIVNSYGHQCSELEWYTIKTKRQLLS